MEFYNSEREREKAKRWYIFKRVCFLTPFAFGVLFYVLFSSYIRIPGNNLAFSLSTCAVALVVAGTYYYAYKFFTEHLYFFICVSWLANAVYLFFDLNGPDISHPDYSTYKKYIFGLSLLSSLFLLLALIFRKHVSTDQVKRIIVLTLIGGAAPLVASYVLITQMGDPSHRQLAWLMLPGSFLAFGLLCIVGTVLKYRISGEKPGPQGVVLISSFYTYAILQFFYPFTPYIHSKGEHFLLCLFLIAQLSKVGNAISLTGVLQSSITNRDLLRDKEIADLKLNELSLEKRKQFVELGVLASSIKHDVSTPLATMAFEIAGLKERYQSDSRIVRKLESLEYSMGRIYAILQVVDIFRGDQAFYNRDQYMSKVNMMEVVHRAVRSIKNERKDLKQVNAKSKIVVEGRDVWARAYAPMLEQVIVNIIKNGLEAIDEAGREKGLIRIKVNSIESGGGPFSRCAKVEIEDNGAGIPEENIDKLTSLFTTRGDKKANSGIGLFIGKKVVDIHSGNLEFDSTLGKGTKVTILLPEWNASHKAGHKEDVSLPESNGTAQSPETELERELFAEIGAPATRNSSTEDIHE